MGKSLEKDRIDEIIEAIMRVARGDYSVQIKLSGENDDFDSLAIGINMMIDDLKKLTESEIAAAAAAAAADKAKWEAVEKSKVELEERAKKLADSRTAMIYMLKDVDKTGKELAAARDYTDNILKSMIDTLIVVDPDAKIKTINKATSDLLGYSEDELIGKPVATIFAEEEEEEEEERLSKGIAKVIKEGLVTNYDLVYITKSGEKIPVSFNAATIKNEKGELTGILAIARDVRELKRLTAEAATADIERKRAEELEKDQEASLNIMEDLERRRKELDDAMRELRETQARLIQTGKMSAMGTLGAGIAHQLNQPLAGIRGFTQAVLMQLDEKSPFYEDLKQIEEQSGYMRDVILNISGFARQTEFRKEPIDINEPIEKALQLLSEQLRKHGINLTKNLAPGLPRVNADANQMQQIFINFIINAREAMPNGGSLTIATTLIDADVDTDKHGEEVNVGQRPSQRKSVCEASVSQRQYPRKSVCISFTDTGPGIPKEIQDKIFEPFFTTKGPKSTGLGLALNYGMIKDHGGEIEVESDSGKGTRFTVVLPVVGS